MQDAFFPLLVAVVAIALVIGVWAASGTGEELRRMGRGGLSLGDGTDRSQAPEPPATAAAFRDEEIRQMLRARNARRLARGLPAADIEEELARLSGGGGDGGDAVRRPADPALEAEVREHVLAGNRRRSRMGREPLDVEAEVLRRLEELPPG